MIDINERPPAVGVNFIPIAKMTGSAWLEGISAGRHETQGASTAVVESVGDGRSLEVFDATSNAKILVSRYAMHLSDAVRRRIFSDIDRLHDVDEWESDDQPLQLSSFQTFLRALFVLEPGRWPSLGLTFEGILFGIWGNAKDRITLEFHEKDKIKWVLSYREENGNITRSAGVTELSKITGVLSPFSPCHWFNAI